MIGIVGGIGPMAGVDLYKRIIENTIAQADQDHLPVLLASLPGEINDRNAFLLGQTTQNPATGLAKVVHMLENAGARFIGIACNTVHTPVIFDKMIEILQAEGAKAQILHLIDITIQKLKTQSTDIQKVGVLCTAGAYKTEVYQSALKNAGLTPVMLEYDRHWELVHKAIYNIKIAAEVVDAETIFMLNTAIKELGEMGAQAIILGCTEIGMVEKHLLTGDMNVYNPNTIMARALIELVEPGKLYCD